MNTIGDYKIPKPVTDQNTLVILQEKKNGHRTTANRTSK